MRRQFVNVKQQSWSGGRAKVGVGLEQIRSCHHVRWSIDQIIRCSDDQLDNQMIKLSDDQEAAQRLKWDWNRTDPVIASDDQFIRWSTYQMIKHSDDQMVNWSGNHIIRWSSNQMRWHKGLWWTVAPANQIHVIICVQFIMRGDHNGQKMRCLSSSS